MGKILRNKKADISITILVLGVVALCFITLLSFVKTNEDIKRDFLGIGLIETVNSIAEENSFVLISEFDSDYENVFSRGNVRVLIDKGGFTGEYMAEGKSLVKVIYTKK